MKKLVVVPMLLVSGALFAEPLPRIHIHSPQEHAERLLGVAPEGPTAQPDATASPAPDSPLEPAKHNLEQESEGPDQTGPKFEFKGFASASYGINPNPPAGGRNLLQSYSLKDRQLQLDGLNLDFEYGLNGSDQVGFRLDTVLGSSYPPIDAAAGLFRNAVTGVSTTNFDIRQAFVRYTCDNGLQIDAGKFATIVGYEIMPGVDGKNPNATIAYSNTYNPFTHTGLRMTYPVNDEVTLTGLAVLGVDQFQDANRSITLGGQVNWHPSDRFSMVFNILDGPEQRNNDKDRRRHMEAVINYKIIDEVNLGLHAFTATEQGLAPLSGTAPYNGFVVYLQTQLSEKFFLNFRQEWYNDPFGIRLGTPAHIRSFTVTPEYQFTPDWATRIDFRFDVADNDVFEGRGQPVGYQNMIWFNQTLKF